MTSVAAAPNDAPDLKIPVPRGPLPVIPERPSAREIDVTVDGRTVAVAEGATILDATRALGIDTPTRTFVQNEFSSAFGAGWGTDIVWDWSNGAEHFDLAGSGATAFAQLTVDQNFAGSGHALVSFGGNQILVIGAAGQITSDDFSF